MATLVRRTNKNNQNRYEIQYRIGKERHTLCLNSDYTDSAAQLAMLQIDRLVECKVTNRQPDKALDAWIDSLDPNFIEKLVTLGLVDRELTRTLGEIWTGFYRSTRFNALSANAARNYQVTEKHFFEFFSVNRAFDKIDKRDAEKWREFLVDSGFAEATVAGHVKNARAVFNWAIDEELIAKNPFNSVKRGSFQNKAREFYVSMDAYRRLLEQCPDQEWRTILALARIGGLRCPSEVLAAQWSDVDWEKGNFLVRDRKRKTTRLIPLFPELRAELDSLFFFRQNNPVDSPYIIATNRFNSENLRTRFSKIVFYAGLAQWERLFHNLRGSRSCELFARHPSHVAAYWMGQGVQVAYAHYLHPTDDDYEKARKNIFSGEPDNPDNRQDCSKHKISRKSTKTLNPDILKSKSTQSE